MFNNSRFGDRDIYPFSKRFLIQSSKGDNKCFYKIVITVLHGSLVV